MKMYETLKHSTSYTIETDKFGQSYKLHLKVPLYIANVCREYCH